MLPSLVPSLYRHVLENTFEFKLLRVIEDIVMNLESNPGPFGKSSHLSLLTRNVGLPAPSDPVQKLFLDKVREYREKAGKTKDGLVSCLSS